MLTLDEALPLFEAALNDDHDRSALTIKAYRADVRSHPRHKFRGV